MNWDEMNFVRKLNERISIFKTGKTVNYSKNIKSI
jgi:hypothetical protein